MNKYFVEKNGRFIAMFRTLKAAQNYIIRKGLTNDEYSALAIYDGEGNEYAI